MGKREGKRPPEDLGADGAIILKPSRNSIGGGGAHGLD
jgi:hypothetical protein